MRKGESPCFTCKNQGDRKVLKSIGLALGFEKTSSKTSLHLAGEFPVQNERKS